MKNTLPPLWLILLIVGLPQLSETVYTPSLPLIARFFKTNASMVEHTLSIYLLGFALGIFCFGIISDKTGRKPCILLGFFLFTLACIGCYVSQSIEALMFFRLLQGFGGSVGSVIAQAISRDSFQGSALGKVFSFVGSAMAIFPAIGPTCGGLIAGNFGWKNIFIFLCIFSVFLILLSIFYLPETHPLPNRNKTSIVSMIKKMFTDRKVITCGILNGGCNGILFSYFAEAPFILIKKLSLSPISYGLTFCIIAFFGMCGGLYSKFLQKTYDGYQIIQFALWILLFFSILSSILFLVDTAFAFQKNYLILTVILCQAGLSFGITMITSNALALALTDYKFAIGAASSLFGCFYYILISFFTYIMGTLHNQSFLPMPLYFLGLSFFMYIIFILFTHKTKSLIN